MYRWQKSSAGFIGCILSCSICVGSDIVDLRPRSGGTPQKDSFVLFDGLHKKIPAIENHIFPPRSDAGIKIDGLAADICVNYLWEDSDSGWVKDVGCFALAKFNFHGDLVAYLTRGPGKYGAEDVLMSVFSRKDKTLLARLAIAGSWGDEGASNEWDSWITDINKDGYFDLLQRYVHSECPTYEGEEPKKTEICEEEIRYSSFIWDGKKFTERELSKEDALAKKFWPNGAASKVVPVTRPQQSPAIKEKTNIK